VTGFTRKYPTPGPPPVTVLRALLLALLIALAAAPGAGAATRLVIRGAGYGHGVGMSQYGALGFAQQGAGYADILRHYYTGTALGQADGRTIRVLLGSAGRRGSFAGANQAGGRRVRPERTYHVRSRADGALDLLSPTRRRLATFPAPLSVSAANGPVALRGRQDLWYRGALEFRPGEGGTVSAINAVGLEDYVAGVVSRESPSTWPLEALKAQAVAARTYAITTAKGGAGFDHYADVRSQVYGGVAAETAPTSQAVNDTRGQVVTYEGQPVVTFFFSTSGGRTEDVENTPLGQAPLPWLKSVEDPYDSVSPRHRWGPIRLTLGTAARKLRGLVRGKLEGIEVVQRGRSPRIVVADVIGSEGATRVNGATLRARFGLPDSWAYFTVIDTEAEEPPAEPARAAASWLGRVGRALSGRRAGAGVLTGTVSPARRGARVVIERRSRTGRWRRAGTAALDGSGRFARAVARPGAYRVRAGGATGAVVRLR
jgi:stage II sporulation protein D